MNNWEKKKYNTAQIKVIGVGGAGCNAINHMIDYHIEGIEFISANTDAQALLNSLAEKSINLGQKMLKGLGAGGIPEIGEKATLESDSEIRKFFDNTDMLFIVGGLGGGTGTGGMPVIAKIAKEMGILVVAAVTKPFNFEGRLRISNANEGMEKLKKNVDSIIIISNDKLLEVYGNNPLHDSFKFADEALRQAIQSITDLIVKPAKINLDFADIKKVLENKKNALFGYGIGTGKQKAIDATRQALNCKLLEASIKGIKNAIISFTGGLTTTLFDVNDSIDYIKKEAGENINILFGLSINKEMGDKMMVVIIGTDFNESNVRFADPETIRRNRKNREILESSDTKYNNDQEDINKKNDFKNEREKINEDEDDEDDLPSFMR